MGGSVYDFIATRNARLAKFTDQHPEFANTFMKFIAHCEQVCREKGRDLESLALETKGSPDGRLIAIKLSFK